MVQVLFVCFYCRIYFLCSLLFSECWYTCGHGVIVEKESLSYNKLSIDQYFGFSLFIWKYFLNLFQSKEKKEYIVIQGLQAHVTESAICFIFLKEGLLYFCQNRCTAAKKEKEKSIRCIYFVIPQTSFRL